MRLPFALVLLALVPGAVDRTPPAVADFHVRAEGRGFAGDRPLLATISPNGDGFRERAAISFRLDERARVPASTAGACTRSTGRPRASLRARTSSA